MLFFYFFKNSSTEKWLIKNSSALPYFYRSGIFFCSYIEFLGEPCVLQSFCTNVLTWCQLFFLDVKIIFLCIFLCGSFVGFCELILRLILDDLPRTKTSLRFLLMQWQAEQNLPSYTYYSEVEGRTDGVHLIRPSYRQFNHLHSHWAKR